MTHHEPQRPVSRRQDSPLRRPWHIDAMIMRRLLRDIDAEHGRLRGRLLDIGCGQKPYAPWLTEAVEYIGVDIHAQMDGPDVCGLAWQLPFADASMDAALCTQVLEHVQAPAAVLREVARVLRPGGFLVLSAPQAWRLHEEPYDFFRFTHYGLAHLLAEAGLEVVSIRPQGGAWMTIGQTVNNAIHAQFRFRLPIYARYALYLASNTLFGTLDDALPDAGETLNYLAVARKP
jgi:SAM-dependent methyltransferase